MVQIAEGIASAQPVEKRGISRWQAIFLVAIMVAITVCEYIFTYQDVVYGIIIALGLALAIYFLVSVVRIDERIAICAESMALIPLYVLFTSSLPWFFLNQQYLLPAVYSCILGLCLWHIYQKDLSIIKLFGITRAKLLKYTLMGLVIGLPLGMGEYAILRPEPAFPTFEIRYLLRDMLYMFLFVGIAEELLFRGLIQLDLTEVFGWKWALFAASALFAIMHLTWRSMPELGFVFIAGVVLGVVYWKTKSLVAPIVLHGANNVMLVAIAPYIFANLWDKV